MRRKLFRLPIVDRQENEPREKFVVIPMLHTKEQNDEWEL